VDPATWAAFAAAWALLVVLPGPDTALAVKHALTSTVFVVLGSRLVSASR